MENTQQRSPLFIQGQLNRKKIYLQKDSAIKKVENSLQNAEEGLTFQKKIH